MQKGAFALIDCLGFKGIWKTMADQNPDPLIKKLRNIERTIRKAVKKGEGGFGGVVHFQIKTSVKLLSDTVAISLAYKQSTKTSPEHEGLLIGIMCHCLTDILDLFIIDDPHLLLRGCVTYGEHISSGNFIVGPAVDEAAEYMNVAEGAFVWLLPDVVNKFDVYLNYLFESLYEKNKSALISKGMTKKIIKDKFLHTIPASLIIPRYRMPIKGGGFLECSIINPLFDCISMKEINELIGLYSNTMNVNKLDVWQKKQNTLQFLEVAKKNHGKHFGFSGFYDEIEIL